MRVSETKREKLSEMFQILSSLCLLMCYRFVNQQNKTQSGSLTSSKTEILKYKVLLSSDVNTQVTGETGSEVRRIKGTGSRPETLCVCSTSSVVVQEAFRENVTEQFRFPRKLPLASPLYQCVTWLLCMGAYLCQGMTTGQNNKNKILR